MKKLSLLFALLLVVVASYAEKPVNHVLTNIPGYAVADPETLIGTYSTNVGSGILQTLNALPNNTRTLYIYLENPVLTSYSWTVSGSSVVNYSTDGGNWCSIQFDGNGKSASVQVSGYSTVLGRNVFKSFGFN